jgi:integrase
MLYKRGNFWWLKYYRNGKNIRESAKTTSKMVAERLLKRREGEIAQGLTPGVYFDKTTFDQLAEGLLQDYRINEKKSLDRAERSLKHLANYFAGWRIPQITTPAIREYIIQRLGAGAANATVNRELSALKRMLNLGVQQTPPVVDRAPHIPMLRENNTRKGFFEHDEFLSLRDALPEPLKGFVTFAYKTGWRVSEISGLTWAQIDLRQGIVRLETGETKNGEGRTVFLDEELRAIMRTQFVNRALGCPYIFHRSGHQIVNFRRAWSKACCEAKLEGRLFHDLRRTAVRNMVRAGVPERVAMMISGHKTRSVFDRYNIVNLDDLQMAAAKQESYLNGQNHGHNLGTIVPYKRKRG